MKPDCNLKKYGDENGNNHLPLHHTICCDKKNTNLNAPFYVFNNKDSTLNHMKSLNDSNMKLFCSDINKSGAKEFFTTTYENIYHLSKNINTNFYECFEKNNNIKLHLDIDCKEDQFDGRTQQEALDFYINESLNFVFDKILNKINISKDDCSYIIFKSENSIGKASAHIIFPNIVFDNIYSIKFLFSEQT